METGTLHPMIEADKEELYALGRKMCAIPELGFKASGQNHCPFFIMAPVDENARILPE